MPGTDEFGKLVWRSGAHATGSRVMITETKLASRWQMMKPELKVTMGVTADEEGTRLMMP